MLTVPQAMEKFIAGIQPTEKEEAEAVRQQGVLREHLQAAFTLREFLISGSFKRHTAIHPLNDIDLFVVLDPGAHQALRNASPASTLNRLRGVLDKAYPNKEQPSPQSRSVNVAFKGTGLAFDIVPAFPHPAGGYIIPDRDADSWIRSNPRMHAEHASAANQRAGTKAKPVVKALKHWNARQEPKIARSFHVEMMVYEVLKTPPSTYAAGIAQAFRGLAARVMHPMPEPAATGPHVDQGMSDVERKRAQERLLKAADTADRALRAEAAGQVGAAHFLWRSLFGEAYPERGTPPNS